MGELNMLEGVRCALFQVAGYSVYPIREIKTPRRSETPFEVWCGKGLVARSQSHANQDNCADALEDLFLTTSTPERPPPHDSLVIGRMKESEVRPGNTSNFHLADWFGIDRQGQRFLEMLCGRTRYMEQMWQVLTIDDVHEPWLRFFYVLRAELLIRENIDFFLDLEQDPARAADYGCDNVRQFVEELTGNIGAQGLLHRYLLASLGRKIVSFPAQNGDSHPQEMTG